MKNPQAHLSNEKAQKELKRFMIAGWVIAVIALFVFAWAAVASLAFGGRCIVLSWHKGNATHPKAVWLKTASIALVVVSALELIVARLGS
jgi:hypothetical protein